jgi:hypothetical protein
MVLDPDQVEAGAIGDLRETQDLVLLAPVGRDAEPELDQRWASRYAL